MLRLAIVLGAVCLALPAAAQVPSKAALCQKAIAEDRMSGLGQTDCLCVADVMQERLDPNFFALWADAIYFGRSREKDMLRIGLTKRQLVDQMIAAKQGIQDVCGVRF